MRLGAITDFELQLAHNLIFVQEVDGTIIQVLWQQSLLDAHDFDIRVVVQSVNRVFELFAGRYVHKSSQQISHVAPSFPPFINFAFLSEL